MLTNELVSSVLNEEELNEFYQKIKFVLDNIDDEVINCHLKIDDREIKKYIFQLKYGYYEIKSVENDIIMCSEGNLIDNLSMHMFYIDIVEIKNNYFSLSGFLKSYFNSEEIIIQLLKKSNNRILDVFDCKTFNYYNRKESKIFKSSINFDFGVPLNIGEDCEFNLIVKLKKDDSSSLNLPITFLNHARLSEVSNYSVWGDYIIHFKNNKFFISKYSFFKMFKWEIRIWGVLLKHIPAYWASALFFRFLYLILFSHYKNKEIWMFMDRRDSADDNAEHHL